MVRHVHVGRVVDKSFLITVAIQRELMMLTKIEKFVCEIIWGGVPTDVAFVRSSKMFIQAIKNFENGKWRELYENKE